jgi:hypothetical protein
MLSAARYYRQVRVSEWVFNSVAFIGAAHTRDDAGYALGDLHATGFFVKVPSKVRGVYLYFVTAHHVIKDLVEANSDIYVSVNKRGGGKTELFSADPPMCYPHPDKSCDLAIIPMENNPAAEIDPIPISELVTKQTAEEYGIGIGDEVYATGLFTEISHDHQNTPILRHGNISLMPAREIQTELGYAEIYLIEARSIGGLSGSPLFVRPTVKIPAQPDNILVLRDRTKLLGVVQGHWDVKESEINSPTINQDRKRGVNYGIAMVVPAYKIIEALNRPELVERREKMDENIRKRGMPGLDSAMRDKQATTTDGKPFAAEDFETALKKASRKVRD